MTVTPAPHSPYEPQMGQVMELIGAGVDLIGGIFGGASEAEAIQAQARREQDRMAAQAELDRVRARIAQDQARQQLALQQEQAGATQRLLLIAGGLALAAWTVTLVVRRRP